MCVLAKGRVSNLGDEPPPISHLPNTDLPQPLSNVHTALDPVTEKKKKAKKCSIYNTVPYLSNGIRGEDKKKERKKVSLRKTKTDLP